MDEGKNRDVEKIFSIVLAIYLSSFALTALLWKKLTYLVAMDDAYYYFSIARNFALGKGITYTDELTNGFQPLWLFLITPFFYLFKFPVLPVRISIFLSFIFYLLSGVLVYKISVILKKDYRLAWFSFFLWLSSPFVFLWAVNGMETSLYLFCLGILIYSYFKLLGLKEEPKASDFILFGLLSGICFLARVDSLLVLIVLWVSAFLKEYKRNGFKEGFFKLGSGAIAFLVLSLPWVIYNFWVFGSPFPVSAVAMSADIRKDVSLFHRLEWLIDPLLFLPVFYPASFISLIPEISWRVKFAILCFGISIWVILFVLSSTLRRNVKVGVIFVLVMSSFCYVLSYTIAPIAHWFLSRYLLPVHLFLIFNISELWYKILSLRSYLKFVFCLFISIFLFIWIPFRLFVIREREYNYYRIENISWLKKNISKDLAIGSFQSGVYHYYLTSAGYRVYNLDGKVSPRAYFALRDQRLLEFMKEEGIVYLIDWEWYLTSFFREYGLRKGEDFEVLGRLGEDWLIKLKFGDGSGAD